MEPITRREMFLAKAGGQAVSTPAPITREEMFLSQIAQSGGGGGMGGADWNAKEGEPGFIANKPFGEVTVDILPETEAEFAPMEDFGGMITAVLPITQLPDTGKNYKVRFGDTVYNCVCFEMGGDQGLGNKAVADAGEDTGEPFVILIPQNSDMMIVIPAAEVSKIVMSVSGQKAKQIAPEYAPKPVLIDLDAMGLGQVTNDETETMATTPELMEKLVLASEAGAFIIRVRMALSSGYDGTGEDWNTSGVVDLFNPQMFKFSDLNDSFEIYANIRGVVLVIKVYEGTLKAHFRQPNYDRV